MVKKEIVFVGNNEKSPVDKPSSSLQPPPYEDTGVKYQGYCKKNYGNNDYRLIPQNKIVIHHSQTGAFSDSVYTVPEGKKLIIGSMFISNLYSGVGTDECYMTDGDSGTIPPQRILFYYRFEENSILNPLFEPKIEIFNSCWVGVTTGTVDLTIYGHLEDI